MQGARDSTNQRRVYVDQSEESRGLVGLSSARGSRFDQSEEGICLPIRGEQGSGGVIECKGLEIRPIRGGYMLTNQRRAGVWWGYRVQGARDSTNQRRVYVDQSEESIC